MGLLLHVCVCVSVGVLLQHTLHGTHMYVCVGVWFEFLNFQFNARIISVFSGQVMTTMPMPMMLMMAMLWLPMMLVALWRLSR